MSSTEDFFLRHRTTATSMILTKLSFDFRRRWATSYRRQESPPTRFQLSRSSCTRIGLALSVRHLSESHPPVQSPSKRTLLRSLAKGLKRKSAVPSVSWYDIPLFLSSRLLLLMLIFPRQDYEDEDELLRGLCSHVFHSECFSLWLGKNSSCPVCRKNHA